MYICTSHVLETRTYDLDFSLGSVDEVLHIWETANKNYALHGFPYHIRGNGGKGWSESCDKCFYFNNNKLLHTVAQTKDDDDRNFGIMYGEEYFNSVNYVGYLDRKDRYVKLAEDINGLLKSLQLDNAYVGLWMCGWIPSALEDLGYEDVRGADISECTVQQCKEKGLDVSTEVDFDTYYGVTFALDVFEHMSEDQLEEFLDELMTDTIVFRIPVCAEEGEDYVLECSRADPTHTIRWTQEQWEMYFTNREYFVLLH